MPAINIGLIGIINYKTLDDAFWQTVGRAAAIGYRGIEGCEALLAGDAAANVRRFNDLGLQMLTISANRDQLRTDLPKLIDKAKTLRTSRVTVWWAECDTLDHVLADAELYNTAGAELAKHDLKLCYHHHDHEFRNSFSGVTAFDWLASRTDPGAVHFIIDIAWAKFGGADPAPLLHRMARRTPSIHVKDLASLTERGKFTTVGTGWVDTRAAMAAAIDAAIPWAVIEQDTLRNLDAWQTLTASYWNLKEMGFADPPARQ